MPTVTKRGRPVITLGVPPSPVLVALREQVDMAEMRWKVTAHGLASRLREAWSEKDARRVLAMMPVLAHEVDRYEQMEAEFRAELERGVKPKAMRTKSGQSRRKPERTRIYPDLTA